MRSLLIAAALAALTASAAVAAPQPPRLFDNSRIVSLDRISVEVVGQGPDLIFIPGLASSRETWKATAERLQSHYRLHLVQVAGFAGEPSRANAAGPMLALTAQAIDDYIVANHLGPATVIGHSMGGTMVLWLAENHPDHLRKALIVDSAPWLAQVFLSPNVTADQAKAVAEQIRNGPPLPEAQESQMINRMVGGEADRAMVLGWERVSDPKVVANAMADDFELDLRPGLAAIKTPITLLYPDNAPAGAPAGASDPIYSAMFAAAPTIKLKRVDNSLHFIMLDQPAVFAADLDGFLAE
jgi:pimeloyl-ACP methyl ester carboxylesterase